MMIAQYAGLSTPFTILNKSQHRRLCYTPSPHGLLLPGSRKNRDSQGRGKLGWSVVKPF